MKISPENAVQIIKSLEPEFFKAGNIACKMQLSCQQSMKTNTGTIEMDIVTDADCAVQEYILKKIVQTDLKYCHIIAEEDTSSVSKFEPDSDLYLTIDPIDGTSNYAKCNPDFALIVALRTAKEQLYTFYHYPVFKWTQIMEGSKYKAIGSPPKIDPIPDDLPNSVLYSFGEILVGEKDPAAIEIKKRNLKIVRRGDAFPNLHLGSTATFTAGYSAGYYAPNPLCVDGLTCLHYAKTQGFPIFSKGPNGEFDFATIEGNHHPGYYAVLRY